MAVVRGQLADLSARGESSLARSALEMMRDAGQQVGMAQAQAAALADSDAMLQLAGDLAARGLIASVNNTEAEKNLCQ